MAKVDVECPSCKTEFSVSIADKPISHLTCPHCAAKVIGPQEAADQGGAERSPKDLSYRKE